jgi:hypothetical protein
MYDRLHPGLIPHSLVQGARQVEAMTLHYDGRTILVFPFSVRRDWQKWCRRILTLGTQDLAVKREGSCFFRYRAFDLRSPASGLLVGAGSAPIPMLGECYAWHSTMIWDTKSFPGLEASTGLTQVGLESIYIAHWKS